MKHSQKNIKRLIAALEEFQKIDPAITLPSMLAFLHYHDIEGRSGNRSTVEERLGMSGATASRATYYWQEWKEPKVRGKNMLERIDDPEDRRYQVVTYKRSGIELLERLSQAIGE
jgi:DNA-binding MarR family transcriptional regulator